MSTSTVEFMGSAPELDMQMVRVFRTMTVTELLDSFYLCRWAAYDSMPPSQVVLKEDREDLLAYRYVMQERGLTG